MKKKDSLSCFEETISFRCFSDVLREARMNATINPDRYENFSHYVRVALINLNNKHKEGVKEK